MFDVSSICLSLITQSVVMTCYYLGQHNFEFRSVSRFHRSGSEAGLISISHFVVPLSGAEVVRVV